MTAPWHPSGERLSAFLDGETSSWDGARILAHLEHCDSCARALEREQRLKISLSTLRSASLPTPRELHASLVSMSVRPQHAPGRHAAGRQAAGSPRPVGLAARHSSTELRSMSLWGLPGGSFQRVVRSGTRFTAVGALSVLGLCLAFVSVLPGTAAADSRASAGEAAANVVSGRGVSPAGLLERVEVSQTSAPARPTAVQAVCLQIDPITRSSGPAGSAGSGSGGRYDVPVSATVPTRTPSQSPTASAGTTTTATDQPVPVVTATATAEPTAPPPSAAPTSPPAPTGTPPPRPQPTATGSPAPTSSPTPDPTPSGTPPTTPTSPPPTTPQPTGSGDPTGTASPTDPGLPSDGSGSPTTAPPDDGSVPTGNPTPESPPSSVPVTPSGADASGAVGSPIPQG